MQRLEAEVSAASVRNGATEHSILRGLPFLEGAGEMTAPMAEAFRAAARQRSSKEGPNLASNSKQDIGIYLLFFWQTKGKEEVFIFGVSSPCSIRPSMRK